MKLRFTARTLPNHSNRHRPIPRNTLHIGHRHGLLICHPHLPGCQLRLINPKHARQRRLFLLHLHLPPHWTRSVLRLLPIQGDMKCRGCPTPSRNDNLLCGIRPTLGTDVLLRCHCHYEPSLCRPLRRRDTSTMNLRRLLRRQRHSQPILRIPLPPSLRCCCHDHDPPYLPARNRIQQPGRH